MEKDEYIQHQEELRSTHQRRLRVLELQAARKGKGGAPPEVLVEIDELRAAIDGIDQELAAIQGATVEQRFARKTTIPQSSNLVQIDIIVTDPYTSITPEIRSATVRLIAALANISAEQIRLVSVMPGSTIYRLEMPNEAVEILMKLHAANDPLLATLNITRIRTLYGRRGAMADNNSGGKQVWVTIVVALIGLVGTLGAAYLSRQVTVAQLQPTIVAAQTNQAGPSQAPIIIEVTSPPVNVVVTSPPVTVVVTSPPIVVTSLPVTVVVTSPPEVVTATPEPTPRPPENTPPGTILEVGQTWKQDGAELKLKEAPLSPDQISLIFEFTSHKDTQIAVTFVRADNFFAFDNNKRKLQTCYNPPSYGCDNNRSYVIAPGDTVQIISTNREQPPSVLVDTTKSELTEVIVKVTGFSTITDAQWRIPINH